MRVRLLNCDGYAGMEHVKFPAEVDAEVVEAAGVLCRRARCIVSGARTPLMTLMTLYGLSAVVAGRLYDLQTLHRNGHTRQQAHALAALHPHRQGGPVPCQNGGHPHQAPGNLTWSPEGDWAKHATNVELIESWS